MSVRQADAVAPERVGVSADFAAPDESAAADPIAGLANLRFLGTALRRRAWVWCATALAGLMIGLGLLAVVPPAYQASASVLLTNDPTANPTDAIQTSLVLAQAWAVAQGAAQRLGLRQSIGSFQASYTVTIVTDRILLITVTAPSGTEAAARANAVAAAFLQFRAGALQIEQSIVLATLGQQIALATQHYDSITKQIAALPARSASATQLARLHHLQAEQYKADTTLVGLEHTADTYPVTTAAMAEGSGVLDAAVPVGRGHQTILFYPVGGLFAGLMIGMSIVIVGALASDHLRRRDDVARALGVPVTLSVGSIHAARWLPGRLRLSAARSRDVRRVVSYLRSVVPAGHGALAAVSVDNARDAALPLVSLALSCARDGKRVVVADLSSGTDAARLLGVRKPGVREVHVRDVRLTVAVPGRDDVVPVGPLHPASAEARPGSAAKGLARAYDSADLLLTLVTLDPVLGAEHVATWGSDVVVVVSAGRSSPVKIHAVGEMMRLAGIPQSSAVLIGADKADMSLGMTWTPSRRHRPAQTAGISG